MTDPDAAEKLRLQLETAQHETRAAYRDRDTLLAALASMYPAYYCEPEASWSLLALQLPEAGWTEWPVQAENRALFAHHTAVSTEDMPEWSGANSEERAAAVWQFTAANWTARGDDAAAATPPQPVTAPETPQEAPPAPKRRGRPRKSAQTAPGAAETPKEA